MKLLVRNLSRETNEEAVEKLFARYGNVVSCDLVLDASTGKSKGFAFVVLSKNHDAEVAIRKLHHKLVDGNKIRVKLAEDKKEGAGGSF